MNLVHINGVLQVPGIDYNVNQSTLSFSIPPATGSDILFYEVTDSGATHVTNLMGDGCTFLFKLETGINDRAKLYHIFETALRYQNNPAVADALDRLKIVVELVKDNG